MKKPPIPHIFCSPVTPPPWHPLVCHWLRRQASTVHSGQDALWLPVCQTPRHGLLLRRRLLLASLPQRYVQIIWYHALVFNCHIRVVLALRTRKRLTQIPPGASSCIVLVASRRTSGHRRAALFNCLRLSVLVWWSLVASSTSLSRLHSHRSFAFSKRDQRSPHGHISSRMSVCASCNRRVVWQLFEM